MTTPDFLVGKAAPQASADRLDALKQYAVETRELRTEIDDLEERLAEKKQQLRQRLEKEIVDKMDEVGVSAITIERDGNRPPFTIELAPYYNANIAASWDDERRQKSFAWLTEHGHGGLIKTEVTMAFGRDELALANETIDLLRQRGYEPNVKQSVHAQTLTAWLRERCEAGKTPPLDIVGGTVGRVAKIKERRE